MAEKLSPIADWDLYNSKKANLKDAEYEGGMHLLRLTIREGTRITIADLHPEAAREMGVAMVNWAKEHETADHS